MEATVKWVRDGLMAGECKGHTVLMDVPDEKGYPTMAPSPMDMLLIGAGGCSGYDVTHSLLDVGVNVIDVAVKLTASTRDEEPEVITKLHATYVIKGDVTEEAAALSVKESHERYSAALYTLMNLAEFTFDIEIQD